MPGQKKKKMLPRKREEDPVEDDGFISPDVPDDSDSDDGMNDAQHEKLLAAMSALQKQSKKKKSIRSEASKEVSGFTISSGRANLPGTLATMKSLENSNAHRSLRKDMNRMLQKSKTLKTPLTKPQAERAKRSAAYDATSEEVSKWQPLVKKNREAKQLDLRSEHTYSVPKSLGQFQRENFTPRNEFEEEMMDMMKDPVASNQIGHDGLTLTERKVVDSMSLDDAKQRRAELQKNRALLSYYERKRYQQNKIKSKTYHRIKRKEKEAKVERALERGTLKHQNTSKWAKNLKIRHHKDPTTRQLLSDNLKRGSERLEKEIDDDEMQNEEDDDEDVQDEDVDYEDDNDVDDIGGDGDDDGSAEDEQENEKAEAEEKIDANEEEDDEQGDDDDDDDDNNDDDDDDNEEEEEEHGESEGEEEEEANGAESAQHTVDADEEEDFGRSGFDAFSSAGIGAGPGLAMIDGTDEGADRHEHVGQTIAESFASADVVSAFATAKQEEVDAGKPKVVDDFLPGWGDWAGDGISETSRRVKKRKRRFISHQKPADAKGRADQKLSHVIIRESHNKQVEQHQVKDLPFPFTSKAQFEKSLRMPIGREWNTEQSFRDLCQPNVLTNMGEIMQPIQAPKKMRAKKS